jgi:hypothetical protein
MHFFFFVGKFVFALLLASSVHSDSSDITVGCPDITVHCVDSKGLSSSQDSSKGNMTLKIGQCSTGFFGLECSWEACKNGKPSDRCNQYDPNCSLIEPKVSICQIELLFLTLFSHEMTLLSIHHILFYVEWSMYISSGLKLSPSSSFSSLKV